MFHEPRVTELVEMALHFGLCNPIRATIDLDWHGTMDLGWTAGSARWPRSPHPRSDPHIRRTDNSAERAETPIQPRPFPPMNSGGVVEPRSADRLEYWRGLAGSPRQESTESVLDQSFPRLHSL